MNKKKIHLFDRKKVFYFLISDIVDNKFFRRYELNLITSKEIKNLKRDCFIFIIIDDFDDILTLIDLVFFTKNNLRAQNDLRRSLVIGVVPASVSLGAN